MTVTIGKWYHYCLTWSAASREQRVYFQGEMIKKVPTADEIMLDMDEVGGFIVLGNDATHNGPLEGKGRPYPFGGELTQLNVFSKELSAQEVFDMKQSDLTLDFVRKFSGIRYIKWEEILLWNRYGNVREIEVLLGNLSFHC